MDTPRVPRPKRDPTPSLVYLTPAMTMPCSMRAAAVTRRLSHWKHKPNPLQALLLVASPTRTQMILTWIKKLIFPSRRRQSRLLCLRLLPRLRLRLPVKAPMMLTKFPASHLAFRRSLKMMTTTALRSSVLHHRCRLAKVSLFVSLPSFSFPCFYRLRTSEFMDPVQRVCRR
jgi:hypothetical protein